MNLAKNAGSKVKAVDEDSKDHIARIIFLNLAVADEKVVSYQMTKAFSKLEKAQSVLNGRDEQLLLELYKYICIDIEPWNSFLLDYERNKPARPKVIEGLVY